MNPDAPGGKVALGFVIICGALAGGLMILGALVAFLASVHFMLKYW